jgi:hypothetical protein
MRSAPHRRTYMRRDAPAVVTDAVYGTRRLFPARPARRIRPVPRLVSSAPMGGAQRQQRPASRTLSGSTTLANRQLPCRANRPWCMVSGCSPQLTSSPPERQEQWHTLVASNEGARHCQPSTGASFVVPATSCCLPSAWIATCRGLSVTWSVGGEVRIGPRRRQNRGIDPWSPVRCSWLSAVLRDQSIGYLGAITSSFLFGLQRARPVRRSLQTRPAIPSTQLQCSITVLISLHPRPRLLLATSTLSSPRRAQLFTLAQ